MQKVRWKDKLVVDGLKAKGDLFGYLGGALQYEEDYGVDWRRVFSGAVVKPPLNSTTFDPTLVEPEIFGTDMQGWDELKKKLKRRMAAGDKKAEDEYYRHMTRVVHLDLYALGESQYAVFRLSMQRTHGTTEEFVDYVLKVYKRPTFIFYDDAPEDYSDWMKQRGLEAKREFYIPCKEFPTLKSIVRFIRDHKEDILHWEENYRGTMEAVRNWRALCREFRWSNRRKAFPLEMPAEIDTKLREAYKLLAETKDCLRNCRSEEAVKKAKEVQEQIVLVRKSMKGKQRPKKPTTNGKKN